MKPTTLLGHFRILFDLPKIHVTQSCPLVERDHKESARVHAHVFHKGKNTICLCKAFSRLPLGHQIGIMLHEIGHIMSRGGEAEADLWVHENLGIDLEFKKTMQWVDPNEVML